MTPFQRLSARAWLWAWALTKPRRRTPKNHVTRRDYRKDANDG